MMENLAREGIPISYARVEPHATHGVMKHLPKATHHDFRRHLGGLPYLTDLRVFAAMDGVKTNDIKNITLRKICL